MNSYEIEGECLQSLNANGNSTNERNLHNIGRSHMINTSRESRKITIFKYCFAVFFSATLLIFFTVAIIILKGYFTGVCIQGDLRYPCEIVPNSTSKSQGGQQGPCEENSFFYLPDQGLKHGKCSCAYDDNVHLTILEKQREKYPLVDQMGSCSDKDWLYSDNLNEDLSSTLQVICEVDYCEITNEAKSTFERKIDESYFKCVLQTRPSPHCPNNRNQLKYVPKYIYLICARRYHLAIAPKNEIFLKLSTALKAKNVSELEKFTGRPKATKKTTTSKPKSPMSSSTSTVHTLATESTTITTKKPFIFPSISSPGPTTSSNTTPTTQASSPSPSKQENATKQISTSPETENTSSTPSYENSTAQENKTNEENYPTEKNDSIEENNNIIEDIKLKRYLCRWTRLD